MQLAIFPPDQPAEKETPGGTGHKQVAVERMAIFLGLQPLAPDFIARAIVADAGRNGHRNLSARRTGRNHQSLSLRRGCTISAEHGDNRQLSSIRMIDKVGGVDSKRLSDAVEPADRNGARAGFEATDGLRRRWRHARSGD